MTKYRVEIDGKKYDVESDTPLTDADLEELAGGSQAAPEKPKKKSSYAAAVANTNVLTDQNVYKDTFGDVSPKSAAKAVMRTLAGAGETALAMGSGAVGKAAGGLAGAGRAIGGLLGLAGSPGETASESLEAGGQVARDTSEGMTYQPKTEEGKQISSLAALPMTAASEGLGYAGEKAGSLVGPKTAAAMRTIGENLPEAAMDVIGLRGMRAASRAAGPGKLTQKQAAVTEAMDNGFVGLPSETRGGAANAVVESIGDAQRTRNLAIKKNVEHATNLVKKELGLPADAAIDGQTLSRLHGDANRAYDVVKNLPDEIDPAAHPTFVRDIRNLDEAFRSVKEYTPDLYNQGGLERIRASLESPQAQQHPGKWTPKAALEVSRYLRSSASRTLANRAATSDMIDGALAAKKGASLLEQLVEDHLDAQGQGQLLRDFKKAREQHAKLYDVEEATNLTTGEVDPQVLRRKMEKGDPLSGELLKIARAADAMPETVRGVESVRGTQGPRFSDVSFEHAAIPAAGALAATGNLPAAGALAGAAAARPLARGLATSKVYQSRMARPKGKRSSQIPMKAAGVLLPQKEESDEGSDR